MYHILCVCNLSNEKKSRLFVLSETHIVRNLPFVMSPSPPIPLPGSCQHLQLEVCLSTDTCFCLLINMWKFQQGFSFCFVEGCKQRAKYVGF